MAYSGVYFGAAWVFTRFGIKWRQQGPRLVGRDEQAGTKGELFGWSVALSASGNTALVGAPDDHALVGAAYIFRRVGSHWTQDGAKLVPHGFVGRPGFGTVALASDGQEALVGGPDEGSSWLYTATRTTRLRQRTKLTGEGAAARDWFGFSVALSADGGTALIGAPYDNNRTGAAWLFSLR
jgi:hypothetical protein